MVRLMGPPPLPLQWDSPGPHPPTTVNPRRTPQPFQCLPQHWHLISLPNKVRWCPCPGGSTGVNRHPPQLRGSCPWCHPPGQCRGSQAAGCRAGPQPQGHSRRWPWGWPGGTGPGGGSVGPGSPPHVPTSSTAPCQSAWRSEGQWEVQAAFSNPWATEGLSAAMGTVRLLPQHCHQPW